MTKVEEDLDNLFHNPYESTRTAILSLNDDCILEIFSRLPLLVLCNVRDTCQRLRTLADYYFTRMHKSLNFGCRSIKGAQFKLFTQDETKSILSSFGNYIEALIIHADLFAAKPDEVLQTVNDFCDNRRLYHLKLIKFAFDENIIESCSRLFSNVEKITIDKCYADDDIFEKLFRKCSSIRHLELMRQSEIDGRCMMHTYPILQGFSLIKQKSSFDPRNLDTFMVKNHQLKELKLMGCNFIDDEIFETIADNLVELESLSIRIAHVTSNFQTNLMNLLRLQHLRELEFNCGLQPIVNFVNGLAMMNRIETLGISSAELSSELCAAICNLKNLQLLKLISIFDTQQSRSITSIATQLTQLKELHVVECEPIRFDEIVEFIARSAQLEKLVINQCCNVVLDGSAFIQLTDACQKRVNKVQLVVHLDYDELCTTKRHVSSDLRREYAHIVQLLQLSWEDTDYCVSEAQCRYFAEEGGVYEYDTRESHRCQTEDLHDFNDPYNVWNDDFDDEDLYPF